MRNFKIQKSKSIERKKTQINETFKATKKTWTFGNRTKLNKNIWTCIRVLYLNLFFPLFSNVEFSTPVYVTLLSATMKIFLFSRKIIEIVYKKEIFLNLILHFQEEKKSTTAIAMTTCTGAALKDLIVGKKRYFLLLLNELLSNP